MKGLAVLGLDQKCAVPLCPEDPAGNLALAGCRKKHRPAAEQQDGGDDRAPEKKLFSGG